MLLYSHSAVSDSLVTPYREPTRLLCLWDRPGKNSGVSCHFPLQGIFWPRDWTRVFCIGRHILYHWATWERWCYNIFFQLHFHDSLSYLSWRDYTFVCFWFLKSAMPICLTSHTSLIFLSEHYLIKFMELDRSFTLPEKLQFMRFYAIFPKGYEKHLSVQNKEIKQY